MKKVGLMGLPSFLCKMEFLALLIWDMWGSARIFFRAGLSVGPVHALDPRNWHRLTTFYVLLLF